MTRDYIYCTYENRTPRGYEIEWETGVEEDVYKSLASELIAKKINCCSYIKSIKRRQLYNGFIEITVNYDNGGRRIYTVKNV